MREFKCQTFWSANINIVNSSLLIYNFLLLGASQSILGPVHTKTQYRDFLKSTCAFQITILTSKCTSHPFDIFLTNWCVSLWQACRTHKRPIKYIGHKDYNYLRCPVYHFKFTMCQFEGGSLTKERLKTNLIFITNPIHRTFLTASRRGQRLMFKRGTFVVLLLLFFYRNKYRVTVNNCNA